MRRSMWGATAVVLAAALSAGGATTASAHGQRAVQARVWVTTVDRSELLHEREPVTFGENTSAAQTIVIDDRQRLQSMDGFGASITDSSASVLSALDPAARERTMRSLFDARSGIGVSFLRQPVGSSDFTASAEHYTYDDVPAGQTDLALSPFRIPPDVAQILPLLPQA